MAMAMIRRREEEEVDGGKESAFEGPRYLTLPSHAACVHSAHALGETVGMQIDWHL